uniref:Nucleoside transporter 3 n=1 Tax=Crithidia fasciculata TaxID=5656 RepID=J9TM52_CRIFA|nr:nucleoside transporter 3 [Crithidia fasciculata]
MTSASAASDDVTAPVPPRKWYDMTSAEFYVYVAAFMCGVSMLMPVNSVFSAPSYMLEFYLYATKDPHHVPQMTNFWSNVLTYFNLISMVTCLVMEPLTLVKAFRRIPMRVRLLGGLCILIVEIIVLMAVPARGTTEAGAVATICIAGFIGGLGTSMLESTVYGMFSAFPPSFRSIMMSGVGMSGVITSLIQIIVKAALPNTYEGVKTQSYIYYGLDVGILATTLVAVAMLRFNSFAQLHFGDLGGGKSKVDAGKLVGEGDELRETGATPAEADRFSAPSADQMEEKAATVHKDDPTAEPEQLDGEDGEEEGESGDGDVAGPTSNEILRATAVFATLRRVKWMFIACCFNYLISLFLFPNISSSVFPQSKWFATISVFIYNCCDVLGRLSSALRFMWPGSYKKRWVIVAVSFARVIFVPLLLLHSYHYIPSEAFGFVMMVLFGFSSGYVASMALVLGPQSQGIDNDGKRFVAGTLMGISILVGGTLGMVLSIMTQTVREKY